MPVLSSQKSHLRALALAKKATTPVTEPSTLPKSTALRRAQARVAVLERRQKNECRNARAKIQARDKSLESLKEQLHNITAKYTATLQSESSQSVVVNGSAARVDILVLSLAQAQELLSCAAVELSRAQHAQRMAESDLTLSQACTTRQEERLKALNAEVRSLRAKVLRVPAGQAAKIKRPLHVFHVKAQREIVLGLKVAVLELVALSVGTNHVFRVLRIAAKLFEVDIQGSLSPASIRGIVQQGGVAAHLQVAEAMHRADSTTISSDSTSIKSINYVAHHLMAISHDPAEKPRRFTLPVTSIYSHSSQAQLDDWIALLQRLADMLRNSLNAPITVEFWKEFARIIRGGLTNHAPDQKCMITLLTSWKSELDCESRGCEALRNMEPAELLEALERHLSEDPDCLEPWSTAAQGDVVRRTGAVFRRLCLKLGEAEFAKLPEETQVEIDLFIWAGCSMHKSLNASRGGFDECAKEWERLGVKPVPLLNRDNAAILKHGTKDDQERVLAAAKGGAYKALEILGQIVKNADDKKGQQDHFKVEAVRARGESLAFPEVTRVRFSTFLYAAAAVIVNLLFFQDFMKLVHNAKATPGWTNIEANSAVSLEDPPTLTELCAAAVYLVLVEKTYVTRVRGGKASAVPPTPSRDANGQPARNRSKKAKKAPLEDENMLEMGPFHDSVVEFCKKAMDDPESILSDPDLKTFDGQQLDSDSLAILAAVDAVRSKYKLEHFWAILAAFFRGAHAKWVVFTSEFAKDGQIAKLSPEQRRRAWLSTTNDVNEGALGMLRIALRRAPNISLFSFNALAMIRQNDVARFFATLTPERLLWVRAEARRLAHGSVEKLRRIELAEHRYLKAQVNVETQKAKDTKEKARQAAEDAEMQGVELEADPARIRLLKGEKLALQIKWHKRNVTMDPESKKPGVVGMSKLSADDKRDRLVELAVFAQNSPPGPKKASRASKTHRVCSLHQYERTC
jgi:hypothetical protein